MNFSFSDEQQELRSYARDFLASSLLASRIAEIADGEVGADAALSDEVAQLGWYDPDLTFLDRAVLLEEAGYALLPGSWFATTVLVRPLLDQGDDLAQRIDEGGARTTLGWVEDERRTSVRDIPLTSARLVGDGQLEGEKILVPDVATCDSVLVPARDGAIVSLFEVTLDGDSVDAMASLDGTRRFGRVRLEGLPARRVVAAQDEIDINRLHAAVLTALSCEAVGVARRALDLAVDYAKTREQFGKFIGSYQGVSHRLSEAFKEIELAKSLAYRSAWAVDSGVASESSHYQLARAAKAQAGHAAVFAAEQAIQVFGGIGMTWDHPIHRWLKRAMLLSAWEGDAAHQREEIANALLERRSV